MKFTEYTRKHFSLKNLYIVRSNERTVNSAVSILSNFLLGRIKDALVQPTTSRDWVNKLTWGKETDRDRDRDRYRDRDGDGDGDPDRRQGRRQETGDKVETEKDNELDMNKDNA